MTTEIVQSSTITQITEVHAGQDKQIIFVQPNGAMHIEMIVQDDIGIELLDA